MNTWYARPVLFVGDVERSIAFYTGQLGFAASNSYAEGGKVLVGQVERDGCSLLLNCQQPEKTAAPVSSFRSITTCFAP